MSLNTEKLKNMILYIASNPRVRDLGTTKLYKLIYFSDVTNLRAHGSTISGSEYIKYPHGPVPSKGEKFIKQLRRADDVAVNQRAHFDMRLDEVTAKTLPNLSVFSKHELQTLALICETKGTTSAKALSEESHQEPAWAYAPPMDKLSPDLMSYGLSEDSDGL